MLLFLALLVQAVCVCVCVCGGGGVCVCSCVFTCMHTSTHAYVCVRVIVFSLCVCFVLCVHVALRFPGVDFYTKLMTVNGQCTSLKVWDTAGTERLVMRVSHNHITIYITMVTECVCSPNSVIIKNSIILTCQRME